MKTQELSEKELLEINGGSIFGGSDGSSQSGLGAGLGIDNLLAISHKEGDGDERSKSRLALGNDISLSLNQLTKSIFN